MAIKDMTKIMALASKVDMAKVAKLSEKVDLNQLLSMVSSMDERTLQQMMKLAAPKKPKALPEVDGDFFDIAALLTPEQREVQLKVRHFMETEVEPIANEYWQRDEFPRQLIGKLRDLDIISALFDENGERRPDASVLEGIIGMEMARIDVSTTTFFGVHSGLAMWSIYLGGSEEQKREWLPKMRNFEVIGAFGLTEPDVGSAVSQGMTTTCRRDGDSWVLNGQKYWIGNSTFSDFTIIWAKDEADGQVKGFIVRKETPGFSVEKIQGKIALRAVENGHITLTDCRVEESDRLQNANSFRTTADVLRATRAGVAWQGVGCAMGAYEKSLAYAQKRQQFGRPIAGFQLVQNLLVQMLGNVTAMQTMCLRLSQLQDAGHDARRTGVTWPKFLPPNAAAKRSPWRGKLHGGKGILLENHVARYFSDTEAIYSYEGTNEINTLVVGRALTGYSAFV